SPFGGEGIHLTPSPSARERAGVRVALSSPVKRTRVAAMRIGMNTSRIASMTSVLLIVSILVPSVAPGQTTLNVVTAGDTNMHDLQKSVFAPEFEKKNPGVKVNAIGSGPGEAGSRVIVNKIKSQKDAGVAKWDVDVAIVHQIVMPELIQQKL